VSSLFDTVSCRLTATCSECNVFRDRIAEEERLLRNKPYCAAQHTERNLPYVDSIDEYCPWRGIVETRQEAQERGLSRPCCAHDGGCLACRKCGVYVVEHHAIAIFERQAPELDVTTNFRNIGDRIRAFGVGDRGRLIEHFEHTFP